LRNQKFIRQKVRTHPEFDAMAAIFGKKRFILSNDMNKDFELACISAYVLCSSDVRLFLSKNLSTC
jgi:hypothetical protein